MTDTHVVSAPKERCMQIANEVEDHCEKLQRGPQ
jgi:hypothetical protein